MITNVEFSICGWTVPLRPRFLFCSSSGSPWPDFLAPAEASALPSISLEEESSCTVLGLEPAGLKLQLHPQAWWIPPLSLFVLSFLGAWVGFALGCWVITVCRRQYLSPLGISSALQRFSLQIHCVFSAVHTLNCGWLLYTQAVVFTRFKPSLKISA